MRLDHCSWFLQLELRVTNLELIPSKDIIIHKTLTQEAWYEYWNLFDSNFWYPASDTKEVDNQ